MKNKVQEAINYKDDKKAKDLLFKFLTLVVAVALILLFCNVLGQDRDGRKQVVDLDGGQEYFAAAGTLSTEEELRLEEMLSMVKGVGEVKVMITYEEQKQAVSVFSSENQGKVRKVRGVMVAAEGADSPIVQNEIISAVASVFDIPAGSVMVFQRASQNVPQRLSEGK